MKKQKMLLKIFIFLLFAFAALSIWQQKRNNRLDAEAAQLREETQLYKDAYKTLDTLHRLELQKIKEQEGK